MDWSTRVASALSGKATKTINDTTPIYFNEHRIGDDYVYEMRPREGVWQPVGVAVAPEQFGECKLPFVWAKGQPGYSPPMYVGAELPDLTAKDGSRWHGYRVDQQANNTQSLYLRSRKRLTRIMFGDAAKWQYVLTFTTLPP